MSVCLCMHAWERERVCVCERESVCVCVWGRECVGVCERERECVCVWERKRESVCERECVCVCMRERERECVCVWERQSVWGCMCGAYMCADLHYNIHTPLWLSPTPAAGTLTCVRQCVTTQSCATCWPSAASVLSAARPSSTPGWSVSTFLMPRSVEFSWVQDMVHGICAHESLCVYNI